MGLSRRTRTRLLGVTLAVVVVAAAAGLFAWSKFFREGPDADFSDPAERFKYGSLGGDETPACRIGSGSCSARVPRAAARARWLGVVRRRLGGRARTARRFREETVGFPRVGNNCALCHTERTARRRTPRRSSSRALLLTR